MKTAIVHDWIIDIGGAEKCLEAIYDIYPSDVYTLAYKEESASFLGIDTNKIRPSFINSLPKATERYRSYLPLFPLAIERFDLSGYDLIISSSHAVAKGVKTYPGQMHISYCYTPMRYAWDLRAQYLAEAGLDKGVKGRAVNHVLDYIRNWDIRTSGRVNEFIAISNYISDRIKRAYGRGSTVIYPPVDVGRFVIRSEKENFYLAASRLVPYKKIDLIVEAFSNMPDKKLVVIGDGPSYEKIKSAASKNIEMLGRQPFNILRGHMQRAKAFVFAADEDFGIVPVEAQACGTPVIAYGRGGALETVIQGETGLFFKEQTVDSLTEAVEAFEKMRERFSPDVCRLNAERFSYERFRTEFRDFVEKKIAGHMAGLSHAASGRP